MWDIRTLSERCGLALAQNGKELETCSMVPAPTGQGRAERGRHLATVYSLSGIKYSGREVKPGLKPALTLR